MSQTLASGHIRDNISESKPNKKFIITGTGRCGTTYVSAVLNICGIKCGHQALNYNKELDFKGLDGDASYKATYNLGLHSLEKYNLICLFRNPVKTIRSLVELDMINGPKPIEVASEVYLRTYKGLLLVADYFFDIENLDHKRLFEVLGYKESFNHILVDSIPRNANTRIEHKRRTLELIEEDLDKEVVDLYKQLKTRI